MDPSTDPANPTPADPGSMPAPDPGAMPAPDPGVAPAPDPAPAPPADEPATSMPPSDGNGTAEAPASPESPAV